MIDNQWNHELGACQARHKIPVALPNSVLTSLLSVVSESQLTDIADSCVLPRFPPGLGFCHGFATVT